MVGEIEASTYLVLQTCLMLQQKGFCSNALHDAHISTPQTRHRGIHFAWGAFRGSRVPFGDRRVALQWDDFGGGWGDTGRSPCMLQKRLAGVSPRGLVFRGSYFRWMGCPVLSRAPTWASRLLPLWVVLGQCLVQSYSQLCDCQFFCIKLKQISILRVSLANKQK